MRTTRTKPRWPLGAFYAAKLQHLHGAFLGLKDGQLRIDTRRHVGVEPHLLDAFRDRVRNDGGRQIGIGAQQGVGGRVGHGPFAPREISVHFVELAVDIGPHVGAPVVQLFLELVLDHLALFFHHQNFLQTGRELTRQLRLQRPDHTDLVQAYAELPAGRVVQAQVDQGLACIVVGLAARDQAKAVAPALDGVVVQAVGAYVGQGGVPLGIEQPRLLFQRVVGPADVHAAGRHGKVARDHDLHALGVDHGGGTRLHDFLDCLHAGPYAGEAAHGKRMNAEVQDFLHIGRKEHRQAAGLEDMVALVRGGGTLGDMVVTSDGDHAAPGRGTRHIGVFEHV